MERRDFIKTTGAAGAFFFIATPESIKALAEGKLQPDLENGFVSPLKTDGPWVVWHWTSANQTKEGVTSNLEGMAAAGIAGATLFSFPPGGGMGGSTFIENPAAPLTPEWFDLVNHAVTEAGRLGITLAIQISAGWATAGGDWIPPELSQQQIVWSEQAVTGGKPFSGKLSRPRRKSIGTQMGRQETINESWENYYRELAVLAFPIPADWGQTNVSLGAKVTTNLPVSDLQKLVNSKNRETVLNTDQEGWIQFAFEKPFTLRSITMNPGSYNRPAHSMEVQASDDGTKFRSIGNLEPMMNSWQTRLSILTHTVPETTATYFRLVYNPCPPIGYDEHMQAGSYRGSTGGFGGGFGAAPAGVMPAGGGGSPMAGARPGGVQPNGGQPGGPGTPPAGGSNGQMSQGQPGGAGPMPSARSQQPPEPVDMLDTIEKITITTVELSSTAMVHHWEGKTAIVWGRSRRITSDEMPDNACVSMDDIIDLTDQMNEDGSIEWQPPAGNWRIMRFGFTTMAKTNGSGIGQGLEADKFSREGARVAFEGWYGRILEQVGPKLSQEVIKMLNVDSWECGSQNWSPVFRDEFKARRGYDVTRYLPMMAGIPVESADVTEGFLFDIRRTIADLISDNFFTELNKLAHEKGSLVNTEAVPPGMMSDGILVHKNVDMTSSEFWVEAWQNWKPCDIRDAASGAHIYGKQIAIAEAFTGGGSWKENPYDLKAMGDMHYVDGINRMMIHVWAAQPYPGRVPGMTGAAGTYFNEHTTWIKPGRAWVEYMRRCQSLLQTGTTVCDALYFIGEEVPCRALIPPRYGSYYVTDPVLPDGFDYDSINQDALLNLATVKDGNIVLPSGVSYRILVMRPDTRITPQLAKKIKELVSAGAQVFGPKPIGSPSLEMSDTANNEVNAVADELWGDVEGKAISERAFGSGRIYWNMPMRDVLEKIGVKPDLLFLNQQQTETGNSFKATAFEPDGLNPTFFGAERKGWGLMWNHRKTKECDFYFLSNQEQLAISTDVSIRITGKIPELWHPDTGKFEDAPVWREKDGRTIVPIEFNPAGSVFIMFRKPSKDVDQVVEVSGGKSIGACKLQLKVTDSGLEKWAAENGQWNLKTKSGQKVSVMADHVPDPVVVEGEWNVEFPLLTGTKKQVKLEPGSWIEQQDEDVKYFSGTATYRKEVNLTKHQIVKGQKLYLDLGEVKNLAEIKINGKDLGVAWKPPYMIEITDAVVVGSNEIEIEVTNTWFNRLTKDAELPEDERRTWVSGGNVRAGSSLIPAGLLGPVSIKTIILV